MSEESDIFDGGEDLLGRCGGYCPDVDMEMKNAVAIQRNAAAIAAIIKTLQETQEQMDVLRHMFDPDSIEAMNRRITALETTVETLNTSVSGLGGINERMVSAEDSITELSNLQTTLSTKLNNTNDALVATQSNLASLVGRVEAIEERLPPNG